MTKKTTKTSHVLNLIANKTESAGIDDNLQEDRNEGHDNKKNPTKTPMENVSVDNIKITAEEVSISADAILQSGPVSQTGDKGLDASETVRREAPVIQVEHVADNPVAEQIKRKLTVEAADDILQAQEVALKSELQMQQIHDQAPQEGQEQGESPLKFPQEDAVSDKTSDVEHIPEVQAAAFEDFEITGNGFEYRPYINIVESIVRPKAIATMKKLNMCMCDKCVNDVIALTLNMLPPKYVVSDEGRLYAKLSAYEKHYSTNMLAAIAKACVRIQKNPRHSE